jgi:hypothetical protein
VRRPGGARRSLHRDCLPPRPVPTLQDFLVQRAVAFAVARPCPLGDHPASTSLGEPPRERLVVHESLELHDQRRGIVDLERAAISSSAGRAETTRGISMAIASNGLSGVT